jgi:phage tail-like protein
MPTGDKKDPFSAFNFQLEIDGITKAAFKECLGLDAGSETVEYREGDETFTRRKLPGLAKYTNITLKRGITDDAQLWAWHQTVIDGKTERKNGSIILLDEAGQEKLRWNIVRAWPSKWNGPSFDATTSVVAFESIEIAHEGVKKG